MKALSLFLFLTVVYSRVDRSTALTTRPSSFQHAHPAHSSASRRSSRGSGGGCTSSSSRRQPLSDRAAISRDCELFSSGWTVRPHASVRHAAIWAAAAAAASASVEDGGEVTGYDVEEAGRCKGVEPLPPLKNRYYALRHGQSVANMEGIISSDPEVGAVKHGLTSNGRSQARVAATALIEVVGRDRLDSLVFVSSQFLRARQTAEECRAALINIISFELQGMTESSRGDGGEAGSETPARGDEVEEGGGELSFEDRGVGGYDVSPPIIVRKELRERWFGELEGTILVNYNKVWPEDLKDGAQEGYGVESVCDVASRVGRLVRSLEREYEDADIVLSSHADTLQIAQCYIAGTDERLFSQYRFKNGEVRRCFQDPSSLPEPAPLSFK